MFAAAIGKNEGLAVMIAGFARALDMTIAQHARARSRRKCRDQLSHAEVLEWRALAGGQSRPLRGLEKAGRGRRKLKYVNRMDATYFGWVCAPGGRWSHIYEASRWKCSSNAGCSRGSAPPPCEEVNAQTR